MTNTTQSYWSVNGTSLQTLAKNITTLGGSRDSVPPLRGDNVTIPGRAGQVFQARVPDARTIELAMWVRGVDDNGRPPGAGTTNRLLYEANKRALNRLFFSPRAQLVLSKKMWYPTAELRAAGMDLSGLPTMGNFTLIEVKALALNTGTLDPQMMGPAMGTFTVDLLLSDPFFYSDPITIGFDTGSHRSRTIQVLGDERTTALNFHLGGPLDEPRFTNSTDVTRPWMQYGTNVAQGEFVDLSVYDFTAQHTYASGPKSGSGYVSHRGDLSWFYLDPGAQQIDFSASGTGTATLTYQPVWF